MENCNQENFKREFVTSKADDPSNTASEIKLKVKKKPSINTDRTYKILYIS